jgi:hypothetical protein
MLCDEQQRGDYTAGTDDRISREVYTRVIGRFLHAADRPGSVSDSGVQSQTFESIEMFKTAIIERGECPDEIDVDLHKRCLEVLLPSADRPIELWEGRFEDRVSAARR